MIIISTDKTVAAYYRTNKRINWKYAIYAGRFETFEQAIEALKTIATGEYMIQDICTKEMQFGKL